MEETSPLVTAGSTSKTQVFWYRWYVLLLYCALITLQGAVWNHWGPISISMEAAFSWDNVTLGLLPFWGPIAYVVSFYGWTLMLRHRGLKLASILSAAMIATGCLLKAIPFQSDAIFTIMCHICGALNGLAGPVVMGAGTKLAAEWFPMNERVTAVAAYAMSQSLGPSLSFLIGPRIVEDINKTATAAPDYNTTISNIRQEVAIYNYIDLGVSGAILLLFLAYFPNRPPLPPSASSQVPRSTDKGLKDLGLNAWLIVFVYGIPSGIAGSFSAVFDINVSAFQIDQTEADWISFIASAVSMVSGLLAGRIIDCFRRPRMALVSGLLLAISTLSFTWFTLICNSILPSNQASIYASNILGLASLTAASPLFFELACESAFPVGEESTTMVMTTCNNVFSGLFLAVLFFPQTGTLWMNYLMAGSCLFSLPLIAFFKEVYHRRQFDLVDVRENLQSTERCLDDGNNAPPKS